MNSKSTILKKAKKLYEEGILCNQRGDWGMAETAFTKALTEFARINHLENVCHCHISIGNVCYNKGQFEQALKHYQLALDEYLRQSNRTKAAKVSLDIGDLYYESQSNWWGAGLFYDKALSLFLQEPNGNETNISLSHYKLAQVYYNMEHTIRAESHYQSALPQMEKEGKYEKVGEICEALGSIYSHHNSNSDAERAFETAYRNYDHLQDTEKCRRVAATLKQIRQTQRINQIESKFKPTYVRASLAYDGNEDEIQVDQENQTEDQNDIENEPNHYLDPLHTKRTPQKVAVADPPAERQELESNLRKMNYERSVQQAKFNLTPEAHPRPLDTISPMRKFNSKK